MIDHIKECLYLWNADGSGELMQVLFAASLLKNNKVIHETLMSAMARKATVLECIDAIEKAA